MAKLSTLGRGFPYPFRFSAAAGGIKKSVGVGVVGEVEKINASLRLLLSVQIEEIGMCRALGSLLRTLVFEPIDFALDARINFIIQSTIERWEHRIRLNNINIDRSKRKDGIILLEVTYTVIETNTPGNLVYPFYLADKDDKALNNAIANIN